MASPKPPTDSGSGPADEAAVDGAPTDPGADGPAGAAKKAASDSAPDAAPDAEADAIVFDSTVSIPSEIAKGQAIQESIMRAVEASDFSGRSTFGMRMALEEAIINAIKHGNKLNPKKSVEIVWRVRTGHAFVSIEDEGAGFNPGDVPDPTDFENLDKPSGRGIMLMQNYLTRVEYQGRGNRVELELDATIEAEKAAAREAEG